MGDPEELFEQDDVTQGTGGDRPAEERSGAEGAAEFLSGPQGAEEVSGAPGGAPEVRRRRPRALNLSHLAGASGPLSAQQRLLLLDIWKRSGLAAGDFATLVGLSGATLRGWRRRFERLGPEGLMDKPRGAGGGSRLDEVTRRAILMLKEAHPEYGCERISLLLLRGPGLGASAAAVARLLKEEGYRFEECPTSPHAAPVTRFERSRSGELWQTDLFTFFLKRQNRRVYLVAFLDDFSRFVTGFGLYASQSTALVLEVLRAAVDTWGSPQEILTDNGSQYVTWRGKSAFRRECEKRGIRQIVARPRRPQTLGKIERFWGTLWRECVEAAVFRDVEDARKRIGLFVDHYNFQRPHQGIDGAVPADRFFGAESEVARTLRERVAANALELARGGLPRKPFYLTGQVGGGSFSVFAEGERIYLRREEGERQEVDLAGGGPIGGLPEETSRELSERYRAWREGMLVADGGAPQELPASISPQGVVPAIEGEEEAGSEEPPGPGESALDGFFEEPGAFGEEEGR